MSGTILTNYHTHTPRCHHAEGSEEEYIQAALKHGYQILGFADHAPWPYATPRFVSHIRMLPEELPGYVHTLKELRAKYAGQIRLHIGLEAEYFPRYMNWLLEVKEELGIEYLILGNHYDRTDENGDYFGRSSTPDQLKRYAEMTVAGMESGAYRYLAHPDLFLNRYPAFDQAAEETCRILCQAAVKLDLPLEYNLIGPTLRGEGRLGYTTPEFWDIAAEYPVKAILGCDAHRPGGLLSAERMEAARAQLSARGITVLDSLPGLE